MDGDTGEGSAIVHSDLIVAVEFIKIGMVSEAAEKHMDRLICVKTGIELAKQENMICSETEWTSMCEQLQISADRKSVEYNGILFLKCPKWLDLSA